MTEGEDYDDDDDNDDKKMANPTNHVFLEHDYPVAFLPKGAKLEKCSVPGCPPARRGDPTVHRHRLPPLAPVASKVRRNEWIR